MPKILYSLLGLLFLLPALTVNASNGTVNPGIAVIPSNGCNTIWGQTIETSGSGSFAGFTLFADHVNFTNALWGGNGFQNSAQSFGLSCSSGNVTLVQINSDRVFLSCSFTGSSCNLFFYYLQSPTEVDLAPSVQIFPNQFVTSQSSYSSSLSPIVYQNQNASYIEIKTFTSGQQITVIYSTPQTQTTQGSNGGGCGSCTVNQQTSVITSQGAYITSCSTFTVSSLGANGIEQTSLSRACSISANPSFSGTIAAIPSRSLTLNVGPGGIAAFVVVVIAALGLFVVFRRKPKPRNNIGI